MSTFLYRRFLSLAVLVTVSKGINMTVCPGLSLAIQDLSEFNKKACNVIEGSLILHSLIGCRPQSPMAGVDFITPLSSIVEITGTLVVINLEEQVDNVGQILPNLAVVRGTPYFRFPEIDAGIVVSENKYLKSINLTKLTHILGNSRAFFWYNTNIRFVETVDWKAISSGGSDAFIHNGVARVADTCPANCSDHCWTANTCQIVLKDCCWSIDAVGSCTACHKECLSFCTGAGDQDCISCRHFHHQGKCVASCPNGTVAFAGWRCVERCFDVESVYAQTGNRTVMTFASNGECVEDCPRNYYGDIETRTCVPCNGTDQCRKRCSGGDIRSIEEARSFAGCKHVEGNLIINSLIEFDEEGKLKEYLGSVEQVDGYVLIINSPMLRSLDFLDNLTTIKGDTLWQFSISYYGLAVVGNRNLQSVKWKAMEQLRLGGHIDVKILLANNYLLCQSAVEELKELFRCAVTGSENGLLAICNRGHLNLTASTDTSTTDLSWSSVPAEDQSSLIGYRILWHRLGTIGSPYTLPNPYDDDNPTRCSNAGWRVFIIRNATTYRLGNKILQPWYTTVFQVRAQFSQYDTDFSSDLLVVNGYQAVPSCPIIVDVGATVSNVSIRWSSPKYYNINVTHYIISLTEQTSGVTMSNTLCILHNATMTAAGESCSVDTAISQIPSRCMKGVKEVDVEIVCSNSVCQTTVSQLRNYARYMVEIQARNAAGCGLVVSQMFHTEADYELDKVTELNVTTSSGLLASTENVQVSWQRPESPNGGCIHYYVLVLWFVLTPEDESYIMPTHSEVVLRLQSQLGCTYTQQGHQNSYSCRIVSNETTVSQNFTLLKVSGRSLSYRVTVRVVSAAPPDSNLPTERLFTIAAELSSGNEDNDHDVIGIVVGTVVCGCLLFTVVGLLLCYVLHLRHDKNRLRGRLEVTSHLYVTLMREEAMLTATEYIMDEWELARDSIVLEREVGHGLFGLVYKGTWQQEENKKSLDVAVKILNDTASARDRLAFLQEASVMKNFESDHVVQLLGLVSDGDPVMVVMELMVKGDLKGYLRSLRPDIHSKLSFENFPLSEDALLQMSVQIAAGMAYLTTKKFVHRDLAARNCMVNGDLNVKIGDFGLTRSLYDTDYYRKTGRAPLPVRWMSPESLRDGVFDHATDVWSYGIVLWEISTLAMQPYPEKSNGEVFEFVTGGGALNLGEIYHAPSSFITIMERCWMYNPSDRPTFENILGYLPSLHGCEVQV